MNYSETLKYLFDQLPMFHRVGAAAYKANLDNTTALCLMLGNPEDNFRSIHVAGTNGKGSVSHMLASILQEAGMKTGLFTSPHLKDFRERIRVNGKVIPKSKVSSFVSTHRETFGEINPSFFEMTAGLAFQYFSDEKVDIAVIETGLGGRLDSTNVIKPVVSVITNISFDHMQFLGDTLEKIAAEKAGIIKPGIPVVIGESNPATDAVFKAKALASRSEIVFADQDWQAEGLLQVVPAVAGISFTASQPAANKKLTLHSPLGGSYQRKNIITVLAVADQLRKAGIDLSEETIKSGIRNVINNTGLAGRWQILSQRPLTICDTGHNEAGIQYVFEQMKQIPHRKLHIVFGMVNDKAVDRILEMLPMGAAWYFCKADIPRGLDAEVLRKTAAGYGLNGLSYPSVKDALKAARSNAGPKDLIFIGGSTFVVAEVV
jgi:dihydrofolate synthase / folylpolyglutamate synthase